MHADDFYVDELVDRWDAPTRSVNRALLRKLRSAPLNDHTDVEAGVALTRLVHDDLVKYGTGGGEDMDDATLREALLTLRAVCGRLNVSYAVPFRDFTDFRSWWLRNDGHGSWQARRDLLMGVFGGMHETLEVLEQESLTAVLASPISPQQRTGWPAVDSEIGELRRQFLNASTPQDYNAVGLVCVRVTETLSATVYDPGRHLWEGESEPPVANTKQRLDRFVEVELDGSGNAEIRRLAKAAIEAAQAVKHGGTPTRRDAGIAADATILLANVLRRITEP